MAIYVHNSLKHLIRYKTELKLDVPECESVFFEVGAGVPKNSNDNFRKKTLLVGCVYRHPRHAVESTSDFTDKLFEKLENYSNSNTP